MAFEWKNWELATRIFELSRKKAVTQRDKVTRAVGRGSGYLRKILANNVVRHDTIARWVPPFAASPPARCSAPLHFQAWGNTGRFRAVERKCTFAGIPVQLRTVFECVRCSSQAYPSSVTIYSLKIKIDSDYLWRSITQIMQELSLHSLQFPLLSPMFFRLLVPFGTHRALTKAFGNAIFLDAQFAS